MCPKGGERCPFSNSPYSLIKKGEGFRLRLGESAEKDFGKPISELSFFDGFLNGFDGLLEHGFFFVVELNLENLLQSF